MESTAWGVPTLRAGFMEACRWEEGCAGRQAGGVAGVGMRTCEVASSTSCPSPASISCCWDVGCGTGTSHRLAYLECLGWTLGDGRRGSMTDWPLENRLVSVLRWVPLGRGRRKGGKLAGCCARGEMGTHEPGAGRAGAAQRWGGFLAEWQSAECWSARGE